MTSSTTSDAAAAAANFAGHRRTSMSNTVHSEVASCLMLPSLTVLGGASDQDLRLFDSLMQLNRDDILSESSRIAETLRHTDVSYLNLRDGAKVLSRRRSLVAHYLKRSP
ncbi:unnamed protein product [Lathyrus sativus]|nr:unnamed protein product [Lathyrus sativus]